MVDIVPAFMKVADIKTNNNKSRGFRDRESIGYYRDISQDLLTNPSGIEGSFKEGFPPETCRMSKS